VERWWTDGESGRGFTAPIRSTWIRPAGFGLQTLDTTEGALGLLTIRLSPAGWFGILGHAGEASYDQAGDCEIDMGSASGGKETDSGVPAGRQ
jgi:hypothetical protein